MMKLRGQTNWDRVMLYNCVHHLLAGILNLIISLHTRNENHNLPRLERRSNLPTTHPDYLVWEIRGNFQKKFTVGGKPGMTFDAYVPGGEASEVSGATALAVRLYRGAEAQGRQTIHVEVGEWFLLELVLLTSKA